jgi:hypothetical protein
MNAIHTIGTISVEAYQKATGAARPRRLSALATVGLMLFASATSFSIGVWNGQHTELLTMPDALQILADDRMPLNRRQNAIGHIYTILDTALEKLRSQADGKSALSPDASTYLRNLATTHFPK